MKNRLNKVRPLFALALMLLFVAACSSGGGDDNGGGGTPTPDTSIAEIVVDTNPTTINVGGSSAVTASVYDDSGSPVSGASVSFSIDRPSLAALSPSTATTDGNGIAHATLNARDNEGEVRITATSGDMTSAEKALPILSGITPDKINLTATPSTLLVEGTAAILAEVLDQDGNPVPDGSLVTFEISNPNFGSMFPETDDTINGFASATFTSVNKPGTATIEVAVGNINNSVDILINQSLPASLEFFSAEPQRITIAGSGGIETSEVQFRVIDENGNPMSGIEVEVNIEKGPGGGEYIDTDGSPEDITVSSSVDGLARVILRSGSTAGPVTLKGTIRVNDENGNEVTFTANSSVVSIGGGIPVASRFSVSASVLNVPGLDVNGKETDITAWLSDRYGNYNILQGTTISFWSEAALAVDAASATVDENGLATVTARTQHPVLDINTGGQDVEPWPWENDLLGYVSSTYGWTGITHPRDGRVSVMAYSQGEEHFDDLNANGFYDGEPFQDTHDDPFLDYNDNDLYNAVGIDPTEVFNDVNNSGQWDSFNGVWDAQKDIFTSTKLLITGEPFILLDNPGFVIPNGGSVNLKVLVCDRNLNYLSAGSKISMSIDVPGFDPPLPAELVADDVELFDRSILPGFNDGFGSHLNYIEFNATILDTLPGIQYSVILTVTVEWEGRIIERSFSGLKLGS